MGRTGCEFFQRANERLDRRTSGGAQKIHDLVRQQSGLGRLMGHVDYRESKFVGEAAEIQQKFLPRGYVDAATGFIEQEQGRPDTERSQQREPLFFLRRSVS